MQIGIRIKIVEKYLQTMNKQPKNTGFIIVSSYFCLEKIK